ncbi:MAG: hypothetical protein IT316_08795 [Anaerolineales bacterium]|nr:hypothetical protein [Anaerolineales bacterium]
MHHPRSLFILLAAGLILLAAAGLMVVTASPVSAQCGSQASSCKNCHEVQGKLPVNNDGTPWHTSHAFGDFCYICHAGNNQAMGEAEAHTGMVPPLEDVQAACQQCHPNNTMELAQVYADKLGVQIGAGGGAPPASAPPASPPPAGGETPANNPPASPPASVVSTPAATELVVNDPNVVDFVQRYNEIVLGKRPVNTGNAILIVLIGLVGLGGGGFVLYNETVLKLGRNKTRKLEGEYPADVVDLLDDIAGLSPKSRRMLKNILEYPQKTETALALVEALVRDEIQAEGDS